MKNSRRFISRCRFLCLTALIVLFLFPAPAAVHADTPSTREFVYYIFWSGIRAGKAVLRYKNTSEGMKIETHATSATFVSLFYKVDDFAQSVLYPDGYPKKFTLKIREGSHRRHKITDFGPGDGPQEITFSNLLDNEVVEFKLDTPAYDPLSAFYAMTRMPIEVGRSEYIHIFDNKKLWNTEIKALKKERVRVPAGEFDTIVVKPLLESEGIFLKKGEMHIWVTDDDMRIPVLFTSEAKIGSFTAMLVEGDL